MFPKVVWSDEHDNSDALYKKLKKLGIKTIVAADYNCHTNIITIYSIRARRIIRYRIYITLHEYLHSFKLKPLDDFIDWINYLQLDKKGVV
jgi:hypothetical protein